MDTLSLRQEMQRLCAMWRSRRSLCCCLCSDIMRVATGLSLLCTVSPVLRLVNVVMWQCAIAVDVDFAGDLCHYLFR